MVSGRFLPRLPACRCANRPNSTNLVLVGSRARPNFPNRRRSASEHGWLRSILEADHKVVDIAHQSGFAPQPALHHALEPEVEHRMQIKVAQKYADRSPFLPRSDGSFHLPKPSLLGKVLLREWCQSESGAARKSGDRRQSPKVIIINHVRGFWGPRLQRESASRR